MGIPQLESRWQRFKRSDLPWELSTAVFGVGGSASGAYKFFATPAEADPNAFVWAWVLGVGAAGAFLGQLGKAMSKAAREAQSSQLHELAGCLHTLNAVLLRGDRNETAGLRTTLYIPDPKQGDTTHLLQRLEYVGDDRKKNTQGRKLPVNVGAIGKAFRLKTAECASRQTDVTDDFVAQMMKDYAFSDQQARALDTATQSWIAVPLVSERGRVEGVLYCDSKQRDFFDDKRQEDTVSAAAGIALFAGLRYD
jgi:hypothetical protein